MPTLRLLARPTPAFLSSTSAGRRRLVRAWGIQAARYSSETTIAQETDRADSTPALSPVDDSQTEDIRPRITFATPEQTAAEFFALKKGIIKLGEAPSAPPKIVRYTPRILPVSRIDVVRAVSREFGPDGEEKILVDDSSFTAPPKIRTVKIRSPNVLKYGRAWEDAVDKEREGEAQKAPTLEKHVYGLRDPESVRRTIAAEYPVKGVYRIRTEPRRPDEAEEEEVVGPPPKIHMVEPGEMVRPRLHYTKILKAKGFISDAKIPVKKLRITIEDEESSSAADTPPTFTIIRELTGPKEEDPLKAPRKARTPFITSRFPRTPKFPKNKKMDRTAEELENVEENLREHGVDTSQLKLKPSASTTPPTTIPPPPNTILKDVSPRTNPDTSKGRASLKTKPGFQPITLVDRSALRSPTEFGLDEKNLDEIRKGEQPDDALPTCQKCHEKEERQESVYMTGEPDEVKKVEGEVVCHVCENKVRVGERVWWEYVV